MRVEGFGAQPPRRAAAAGAPDLADRVDRAAPGSVRGRAIRPVVVVAFATFAVTSLVFPVATTWGTFLHTAGPFHVLLVISALLALDAVIARLGVAARLDQTGRLARSPARHLRLGPVLGSAAAVVRVRLAHDGGALRGTGGQDGGCGPPTRCETGPVITNFPIWLAETQRISVLALPDEPPRRRAGPGLARSRRTPWC